MSEAEWVKCPGCGSRWTRLHTGRYAIEQKEVKPAKAEFSFDKDDRYADASISVREAPGGIGKPSDLLPRRSFR